ncbi:cell wall-binding repeat-containing protein [Guptibacillus hwajinpoensis]|uniref:Cell wall-binding protein/subtilisin family serine protease n=1 Tax=Guptibacillus hwajinpoensis TaxID=208199 RepID=A0ABU0K085_9BACL|nr:cell wall-binding repeat-containing protein [Alkalihalobacillus hemicentroti]MDQ0482699.1 putative cell wall-binding protein/subtilisin family serine protease [Alkalihalobacillus hemicentroti]
MTFKKKFLTVVAGASLVTSSFAGLTYNPEKAEAALTETKKFKLPVTQEIASLAASEQAKQELIIVANKHGGPDLTKELEALGVTVKKNTNNYLYLAEVPTRKILQVYRLDSVGMVGANNQVVLEESNEEDTDLKPKVKNPEEIVKPATEETHSATGVDEFHDKYDGTGVKVGIIDTGIDPGHEAFTRYDKEGNIVSSKVKGVVDTVGEGDVVFDQKAPETASLKVGEETYNTAGIDASDDTYYFGTLKPSSYGKDKDGNAVYYDLNGDKKGDSEFDILHVDDEIYIDSDQDMDFTDEEAYSVGDTANLDVNLDDEVPGANFTVANTLFPDADFPTKTVFFDGDGHGTHVSGITAANGPANENETGAISADGVAPGADLYGLKVFDSAGRTGAWAIANAMYLAAIPEELGGFGTDVVNMSLGSSPDLNDGSGTYSKIIEDMGEAFDTIYVTSAGNDGPGVDSVGAPGDSIKALSIGAYINSKMWATEYGYYPYGKNADGSPVQGEGLWYFSANGPTEDGQQKPDFVAPGSAYASFPVHLGNYAVLQGTSMSSPYAAGAVAVLKQAALKDRIPFDYELAREALIQTAVHIDGYTRVAEGAGLIDVPAAYEYIRKHYINEVKEVNVTVYHGEKVSGGPGLYVRNKDVPEEVTVMVENPTDETKNLTISSDSEWFTPSVENIELAPGEFKEMTVSYDKSKMNVGVNAGTLLIDDPNTAYAEARSFQTIILGEDFTSEDRFRLTHEGEVQSSKTKSYFFNVKPGAQEIRFALEALKENDDFQGRVRMLVMNPDGDEVNAFQGYAGYGGLGVEDYVAKSPKSGVWEVAVYGTAAPKDGYDMNKFKLEAFVQDVVSSPGKIELGTMPGTEVAKSVTFENYLSTKRSVEVVGGEFSKGETSQTRENVAEGSTFDRTITLKNNITLDVSIGNTTNAEDDLDLFIYRSKDGKVIGDYIAIDADGDSEESISLKNLPDGEYIVRVDGYATVEDSTDFDLSITEAKVLEPGEEGAGSIEVTGKSSFDLGVGKKATTDVKITTPKDSGQYTAGIFLKDKATGEVLSIIPVETDGELVDVVAGENRIETAIEVSKEMYPEGETTDTVFIATGYNFPDALSAGPLASAYDAPILLAGSKGTLSDEVLNEISRLKAKNVVILGGENAISKKVNTQLANIGISTADIERLSGDNRYDTNVQIINKLAEKGSKSEAVFLATGKNFADALSAASIAGANDMPIILTDGKSLTDDAKKLMAGKLVYVLGGDAVITDQVVDMADEIATTKRLAGANRYGTLVEIHKELGSKTDNLFVANGRNFPDALAASPLVVKEQGSMFLVESNKIPKEIESYLVKYFTTTDVSGATVLGGDNAVNKEVRDQFNKWLNN